MARFISNQPINKPVNQNFDNILLKNKVTENPIIWRKICLTGDFVYNEEPITLSSDKFQQAIKNFYADSNARPCFFGHADTEIGLSKEEAPARGWILGLAYSDNALWAAIQPTDAGKEAIEKGEYIYPSIRMSTDYENNQGEKIGCYLISCALTNIPFIKNTGAIQMSEEKKDNVNENVYIYLSEKENYTMAKTETAPALENVKMAEAEPTLDDFVKAVRDLEGDDKLSPADCLKALAGLKDEETAEGETTGDQPTPEVAMSELKTLQLSHNALQAKYSEMEKEMLEFRAEKQKVIDAEDDAIILSLCESKKVLAKDAADAKALLKANRPAFLKMMDVTIPKNASIQNAKIPEKKDFSTDVSVALDKFDREYFEMKENQKKNKSFKI